jgi:hypothetical protein
MANLILLDYGFKKRFAMIKNNLAQIAAGMSRIG